MSVPEQFGDMVVLGGVGNVACPVTAIMTDVNGLIVLGRLRHRILAERIIVMVAARFGRVFLDLLKDLVL